ncbi:MAG: glucose sorbosone dehydrogenase [Acidobacteria bacterium]|nr:glucose sorbosone dehydrogenase [Acidobacteriota bacterium]
MKHLLLAVAAAVFASTVASLAQQAPGGAPPAAAGRGGRGPDPQQIVFNERCASCHGVDLNGARAPSLFSKPFLEGSTDTQLRETILEGKPGTDMPAFGNTFTPEGVDALVTWIRVQSGTLIERPAYVADPNGQLLQTGQQRLRIEVFTTGLDTPWGMGLLPDGRLVVSERPGRIRIIARDGTLGEPVKSTPTAWVRQDGGYFDVAVHPDYARTGWIYLSYSELVPGYGGPLPPPGVAGPPPGFGPLPPSNTRIVRGKINASNEWVDQQDVARLPDDTYSPSIIHYGQRFLFDGNGHLFWTLGDRGSPASAQNLSDPRGKIHRVNDDGTIPQDNPFVNTPGALGSIWSYGHRNPQGLAFDPLTSMLWETEHGPTGGDEVNIIEKGRNYGWGVTTKGVQAGLTQQSQPGMEDPIVWYTPSVGPSGITFYTATRYPAWRNTSLFVAMLTGQKLMRLEIDGRRIVDQETIFEQFGRVRQLITGPDGLFYLLLQNPTGRGTTIPVFGAAPGMVIRLQPVT